MTDKPNKPLDRASISFHPSSDTISPGAILAAYSNAKLSDLVVCAFLEETGEFVFAGSNGDGADCLWLLQKGIQKLMEDDSPMTDRGKTNV